MQQISHISLNYFDLGNSNIFFSSVQVFCDKGERITV